MSAPSSRLRFSCRRSIRASSIRSRRAAASPPVLNCVDWIAASIRQPAEPNGRQPAVAALMAASNAEVVKGFWRNGILRRCCGSVERSYPLINRNGRPLASSASATVNASSPRSMRSSTAKSNWRRCTACIAETRSATGPTTVQPALLSDAVMKRPSAAWSSMTRMRHAAAVKPGSRCPSRNTGASCPRMRAPDPTSRRVLHPRLLLRFLRRYRRNGIKAHILLHANSRGSEFGSSYSRPDRLEKEDHVLNDATWDEMDGRQHQGVRPGGRGAAADPDAAIRRARHADARAGPMCRWWRRPVTSTRCRYCCCPTSPSIPKTCSPTLASRCCSRRPPGTPTRWPGRA